MLSQSSGGQWHECLFSMRKASANDEGIPYVTPSLGWNHFNMAAFKVTGIKTLMHKHIVQHLEIIKMWSETWCSHQACFRFKQMFKKLSSVVWKFRIIFDTHGEMRCYYVIVNSPHWGRDKLAAIRQTTFSNAVSWVKMYERRLKFHLTVYLRIQLTLFYHWFR